MSEPIQNLVTLLLNIVQTSPGENLDDAIEQAKSQLALNQELTSALQTDSQMLQINLGQSKSYQIEVNGHAIAYIGQHYHLDIETVLEAIRHFQMEVNPENYGNNSSVIAGIYTESSNVNKPKMKSTSCS